jgi:DNA-binding NarL/FixJ family response regulator
MGPPRPRRPILIVDDDPQARAAIAAVLDRAGYATRLADSGEEALAAAREDVPALVVLDVCLPGVCGYQVCHELRKEFGTGLPIVFVSAVRTDSYDRVAGFLIGGDEFLAKPVAPDELLIRVERLLRRAAPLDPAVTAKLTSRELEVVHFLADGMSAREIAERLFISPKTVSTHIDRVMSKLGVHSRAQLVAAAHRRDLVATPS